MKTLELTEIYPSIQGESTWAGRLCVFIRLAGCPLRCRWCDTAYSFGKGQSRSLESILEEITALGIRLVELTGGEPLAQESCKDLLHLLDQNGFETMIETGGSISIDGLPSRTKIIMDIKCPDSGMSDRNLWSNMDLLQPKDEVKFVVASQRDFQYAMKICHQYQLATKTQVLFSAAFGLVKEQDLVSWMLESRYPARLNMQIHKYIWSPRTKGV